MTEPMLVPPSIGRVYWANGFRRITLAWPEDVRYELIDGMAYLMAPAPALDHQDIAAEIYFQLRRSLEGKSCRAFIAPVDVRLPKGEELDEQVDTVVQPDVLVVCDAGKLDAPPTA